MKVKNSIPVFLNIWVLSIQNLIWPKLNASQLWLCGSLRDEENHTWKPNQAPSQSNRSKSVAPRGHCGGLRKSLVLIWSLNAKIAARTCSIHQMLLWFNCNSKFPVENSSCQAPERSTLHQKVAHGLLLMSRNPKSNTTVEVGSLIAPALICPRSQNATASSNERIMLPMLLNRDSLYSRSHLHCKICSLIYNSQSKLGLQVGSRNLILAFNEGNT